jgi:hypothetical protein
VAEPRGYARHDPSHDRDRRLFTDGFDELVATEVQRRGRDALNDASDTGTALQDSRWEVASQDPTSEQVPSRRTSQEEADNMTADTIGRPVRISWIDTQPVHLIDVAIEQGPKQRFRRLRIVRRRPLPRYPCGPIWPSAPLTSCRAGRPGPMLHLRPRAEHPPRHDARLKPIERVNLRRQRR